MTIPFKPVDYTKRRWTANAIVLVIQIISTNWCNSLEK